MTSTAWVQREEAENELGEPATSFWFKKIYPKFINKMELQKALDGLPEVPRLT